MKLSELLSRIEKLRSSVAAAIEADLIDNNADMNNFELMYVDEDGNELEFDDVQLDIMGEPYRIMLVKNEE